LERRRQDSRQPSGTDRRGGAMAGPSRSMVHRPGRDQRTRTKGHPMPGYIAAFAAPASAAR
jgi:hypothetical protein